MIKVDRTSISKPKTTDEKRFKAFIQKQVEEKTYRRDSTYLNRLSEGLKGGGSNKCWYCETRDSDLQIDHYRPTGTLKDDDSHPGYYWLGYEWTNLVPACSKCNRYKSSRFPIKGKRVKNPPIKNGKLDWASCRDDSEIHRKENPLLLHPAIDNPEEHLHFLPDGRIKGTSPRGEATVKTCKLDRKTLVVNRSSLIGKFCGKIIASFHKYSNQKIGKDTLWDNLDDIFTMIKRANQPQRPYSRLGWFLYYEFDAFIARRVGRELERIYQDILSHALKRFRNRGTCRTDAAPAE